jgi:hypothetical protein
MKEQRKKDLRVNMPEYRAWLLMKNRCLSQKSGSWKLYGGRGISVYSEWVKSFDSFYDYIGARPSKECSLDRIDNNGNYEPGNVRWATRSTQGINRRKPINKSGVTGVYYRLKTKQWIATIWHDGRRIREHFNNKEAAVSWRKEAEEEYYRPLLAS